MRKLVYKVVVVLRDEDEDREREIGLDLMAAMQDADLDVAEYQVDDKLMDTEVIEYPDADYSHAEGHETTLEELEEQGRQSDAWEAKAKEVIAAEFGEE